MDLTMSTFAWEFSRSPIDCEVTNLSLDEILIYLLHTLSHYLRKKYSVPSDMVKFCNLFDIIFEKILNDPEILVEDEKRIVMTNLFITIEECCTKLITPLNLRVENDNLDMDKLSQNVRDILELIKHHSSDPIPFKILCAATHNLINRFEERSEFISQFKDSRYRYKIINEKHPKYSAENKVFLNAQETLFNRTYFAIAVKSNGTVAITKSKIDFRPSKILLDIVSAKRAVTEFITEDAKISVCEMLDKSQN